MADTIFALSTLAGRSGVAVVRISGEGSLLALNKLCPQINVEPRVASLVHLADPSNGEPIDQAIILYFKAPNSFTGEDIVEIQFHGSIAVIDHLLETLGNMEFLRMAEPGEFSKRAFLNSKLDLTQAEALVDLIDAETRLQKNTALRQLNGQLGALYNEWRSRILNHLFKLEALIDFPEDDIPKNLVQSAFTDLVTLSKEIKNHLSDNNSGEILNRGLNVAIVGAPNAGKSSLLNLLAKSDVAIVSDIAGTTRDVLKVKINLNGFPLILYDTAGIRETHDSIEQEGVKRAMKTLEESDVQLIVLDIGDKESLSAVKSLISKEKPTFVLFNKRDKFNDFVLEDYNCLKDEFLDYCQLLEISAKTGYATDQLINALSALILSRYSISNEPLITHHRYRVNLTNCVKCLDLVDEASRLDISTEYIRLAASELGMITGKIEVEEILDLIFSSFCIGK